MKTKDRLEVSNFKESLKKLILSELFTLDIFKEMCNGINNHCSESILLHLSDSGSNCDSDSSLVLNMIHEWYVENAKILSTSPDPRGNSNMRGELSKGSAQRGKSAPLTKQTSPLVHPYTSLCRPYSVNNDCGRIRDIDRHERHLNRKEDLIDKWDKLRQRIIEIMDLDKSQVKKRIKLNCYLTKEDATDKFTKVYNSVVTAPCYKNVTPIEGCKNIDDFFEMSNNLFKNYRPKDKYTSLMPNNLGHQLKPLKKTVKEPDLDELSREPSIMALLEQVDNVSENCAYVREKMIPLCRTSDMQQINEPEQLKWWTKRPLQSAPLLVDWRGVLAPDVSSIDPEAKHCLLNHSLIRKYDTEVSRYKMSLADQRVITSEEGNRKSQNIEDILIVQPIEDERSNIKEEDKKVLRKMIKYGRKYEKEAERMNIEYFSFIVPAYILPREIDSEADIFRTQSHDRNIEKNVIWGENQIMNEEGKSYEVTCPKSVISEETFSDSPPKVDEISEFCHDRPIEGYYPEDNEIPESYRMPKLPSDDPNLPDVPYPRPSQSTLAQDSTSEMKDTTVALSETICLSPVGDNDDCLSDELLACSSLIMESDGERDKDIVEYSDECINEDDEELLKQPVDEMGRDFKRHRVTVSPLSPVSYPSTGTSPKITRFREGSDELQSSKSTLSKSSKHRQSMFEIYSLPISLLKRSAKVSHIMKNTRKPTIMTAYPKYIVNYRHRNFKADPPTKGLSPPGKLRAPVTAQIPDLREAEIKEIGCRILNITKFTDSAPQSHAQKPAIPSNRRQAPGDRAIVPLLRTTDSLLSEINFFVRNNDQPLDSFPSGYKLKKHRNPEGVVVARNDENQRIHDILRIRKMRTIKKFRN